MLPEHLLIELVPGHAGKLVGAEIIIGVFEGLGSGTHRFRIAHIAQSIIFLPSGTAVGTSPGAFVERLMGISLESLLRVEIPDTLRPCIGQQRYGMVAEHTAGLTGT